MEAQWQMLFLTDSELFYIYENTKSKKVHGTFGLGWKYKGRTEVAFIELKIKESLFWTACSLTKTPYLF